MGDLDIERGRGTVMIREIDVDQLAGFGSLNGDGQWTQPYGTR